MSASSSIETIKVAMQDAAKKLNFFRFTEVDQYPGEYVIAQNSFYDYEENRIDKYKADVLVQSGFLVEHSLNGVKGYKVASI